MDQVEGNGDQEPIEMPQQSCKAPNSISQRIRLNISGQKFEMSRETLIKHPSSRLGKMALLNVVAQRPKQVSELYDYFDSENQEYFFERDPSVFPTIISFYFSGKLHIPRDVCVELFVEELRYWGIPFHPADCCQGYHQQQWEVIETVRKTRLVMQADPTSMNDVATVFPTGTMLESKLARWQRLTWNLFEDPKSSRAASIMSVFSAAMVAMSTIALCVGTLPDVQVKLPDGGKLDHPVMANIELVCVIWFTLEFVARICSAPQKARFLLSVMNAVDILAFLPFYVSLAVESGHGTVHSSFTGIRRSMSILRVFRIVRIFKIARHSSALKVLGYTVRHSGPELGLLFMLLLMGVVFFSSLVYYAEENVPGTKFVSIIQSFWWALITMTTVGYGDMTPTTTFGQIVGGICCVSGILVVALPIPTIVGNFSAYYKDHVHKERLSKLYAIGPEVRNGDAFKEIASHQVDPSRTWAIKMDI